MNQAKYLLSLVLFMLISPIVADAQSSEVSHYINFQGVLRDDSGNLIQEDFIDLEFKILDQDGEQLYYELQPGVQVVRSSVNVMIGEGIIPGSSPSTPTGGVPLAALDPASGTKRLVVKVGSNLEGEPMELGSVPFALYAEKALGLVADIAEGAIPASFVTETELTAAISQEQSDRTTAGTNLQNQIDTANANITNLQNTTSNINNIPGTLNESKIDPLMARDSEYQAADAALQTQITNEATTRANTDTTLQNNINTAQATANTAVANAATAQATADSKVSRSGDTMSGTLNMGGNQITNVGNVDGYDVSATLANHENRIDALEGAFPTPAGLTRSLTWRTDIDNASGGQKGGQDAGAWSLSGVGTADGRWVTLVRNPISIPANCLAIASGTISPNASTGTEDNYDWDDASHLKISHSGSQVNLTAYALGNDGRYAINFRVLAVPTSDGADCSLGP